MAKPDGNVNVEKARAMQGRSPTNYSRARGKFMLQIGRASLPRTEQLATYWLGNAKALYEPVCLADQILQRMERTVVEEKTTRTKGLKKLRGIKRKVRASTNPAKEEIQISAMVWWSAFAWNVLYAKEEEEEKKVQPVGPSRIARFAITLTQTALPIANRALSTSSAAIKSLEQFASSSQTGDLVGPIKVADGQQVLRI